VMVIIIVVVIFICKRCFEHFPEQMPSLTTYSTCCVQLSELDVAPVF